MTVNERLYGKGLLARFDKAKDARDISDLEEVFRLIGLPDYDVMQVLK